MKILHNGLQRTVLGITRLMAPLQRSSRTIRRWEQNGTLPPALRVKAGRFYLPEEIEAITTIAKEEKIGQGVDMRKTKFVVRVHAEIARLRDATKLKEENTNE